MQCTGTWHTNTCSRRSFTTLRATNVPCIGMNLVLTLQFWRNFLIRNSTNMKMMRNLITVSGPTADRALLTIFTDTYEESKETLTDVIDDLTRHSQIVKLKITSSWFRTKYKTTTAVKNTASYIPWLYATSDHSIQHDSLSFSPDRKNHCTSFLYQFQTALVYYLKANHPNIIKD